MNQFDYLILAIVGFSGILGLFRGLIKELMSLVAYLVAAAAAVWWGPQASTWIETWLTNPLIRSAVAYLLVFIMALLGVGLINMALSALIERTGLSTADHGFGMLFGVLRGIVLVLVLVTAAGYTQMPTEPWWHESSFVKTAIQLIMRIKLYLPPDIAAWLPY